jgi:hypothetical protein
LLFGQGQWQIKFRLKNLTESVDTFELNYKKSPPTKTEACSTQKKSADSLHGCQIYLGTKYQNGKNIPNGPKCTSSWRIVFQMAINYSFISHSKALVLPELRFLEWKNIIWQPWIFLARAKSNLGISKD